MISTFNNQSISDQVNNFINSNSEIEKTLIIKGPWGIGKTHLVKNIIKMGDLDSESKYISLLHKDENDFISELFSKDFNYLSKAKKERIIQSASLGLSFWNIGLSPKLNINPKKNVLSKKNRKKSKYYQSEIENYSLFVIDDLETYKEHQYSVIKIIEGIKRINKNAKFILLYGEDASLNKNTEDDNFYFKRLKEKLLAKCIIMNKIEEIESFDRLIKDNFDYATYKNRRILQNINLSIKNLGLNNNPDIKAEDLAIHRIAISSQINRYYKSKLPNSIKGNSNEDNIVGGHLFEYLDNPCENTKNIFLEWIKFSSDWNEYITKLHLWKENDNFNEYNFWKSLYNNYKRISQAREIIPDILTMSKYLSHHFIENINIIFCLYYKDNLNITNGLKTYWSYWKRNKLFHREDIKTFLHSLNELEYKNYENAITNFIPLESSEIEKKFIFFKEELEKTIIEIKNIEYKKQNTIKENTNKIYEIFNKGSWNSLDNTLITIILKNGLKDKESPIDFFKRLYDLNYEDKSRRLYPNDLKNFFKNILFKLNVWNDYEKLNFDNDIANYWKKNNSIINK